MVDVPEPPESDGAILVETLGLGICGTDREIVAGHYGWSPSGRDRLIIGHESLGRVLEAPADAARWISGEPVLNEELHDAQWLLPAALNGLNTTEGLAEIVSDAFDRLAADDHKSPR